jgi:hypothetical protein
MDILQWNVIGLHTHIPELVNIRIKYAPAAVCFQVAHLCPAHNAPLRSYTSYLYDHLPGDRANGGTAVFIHDSVRFYAVPLQTTMQAVVGQLFMVALIFTNCSVYLPPYTALSLADLQDLLSQFPTHLILL